MNDGAAGAAAVDGEVWILLEGFWACADDGGGCRRRDVVWRSCWLDLVVGLLPLRGAPRPDLVVAVRRKKPLQ